MNRHFCLLYYFLNLIFYPYPLYSLAQDKNHDPYCDGSYTLITYRRTYGGKSPGIGNANFSLHSLDMIISAITLGIMVFVLC